VDRPSRSTKATNDFALDWQKVTQGDAGTGGAAWVLSPHSGGVGRTGVPGRHRRHGRVLDPSASRAVIVAVRCRRSALRRPLPARAMPHACGIHLVIGTARVQRQALLVSRLTELCRVAETHVSAVITGSSAGLAGTRTSPFAVQNGLHGLGQMLGQAKVPGLARQLAKRCGAVTGSAATMPWG